MELDKKKNITLFYRYLQKKQFILSTFTSVLLGQNALKSNRHFLNRKAGY